VCDRWAIDFVVVNEGLRARMNETALTTGRDTPGVSAIKVGGVD
jgi:hypothetical protein